MMGNSKKILVVLLIGVFLVGGTAYAGSGPFTKFGRGLTNIILSPGELIYQPAQMAESHNGAIAFLGGLPKGIVFIPVRIALGAYDVATFLVPYPKHYGYWMEPETIVEGFHSISHEAPKA